MTRYSGTCTLLAGVSCFALVGGACMHGSDTGEPVTGSSDDESVLAEMHSTLPTPPDDDIPRPSGRPEGLRVLDWAGFRGAVSYTFDDSQPSQIEHYAELQAAGVPMTFYLSSGWADTSPLYEATWRQAVRDGHEIGNHTVHH